MLRKATATIIGRRPIIMHSVRTVDPLDPLTIELKKLLSKRGKTDEDLRKIASLEYEASLYWDDSVGGLYIPNENIQSMLHKGATKFKLGRKIIAALVSTEEVGPRLQTPNWDNWAYLMNNPDGTNPTHFRTSIVVNRARIMKTRPYFPAGWKLTFPIDIDTDVLNIDEVEKILAWCGKMVGLGDWRPSAPVSPGTFGRFDLIEWEVA